MEKTIKDKRDLLIEYLEKNEFTFSYDTNDAEVYSASENKYISINSCLILAKRVFIYNNIATFERFYNNSNIQTAMVAFHAIKWFK